jgi:hypothetical protein
MDSREKALANTTHHPQDAHCMMGDAFIVFKDLSHELDFIDIFLIPALSTHRHATVTPVIIILNITHYALFCVQIEQGFFQKPDKKIALESTARRQQHQTRRRAQSL